MSFLLSLILSLQQNQRTRGISFFSLHLFCIFSIKLYKKFMLPLMIFFILSFLHLLACIYSVWATSPLLLSPSPHFGAEPVFGHPKKQLLDSKDNPQNGRKSLPAIQ
jgi:hypothetical protein